MDSRSRTLDGQRVVVVGGSAGIGLAVARAALERGARVTILGRSEARLAAAAAGLPAPVETAVADVGEEGQVNRALAAYERVDHAYVAAGTASLGGVLDGTAEELLAPLVERVWGGVYVARALSGRVPPGGSLTLTGGLSSDRPFRGGWVAAVGTAAAEQLARALALEMAPVRVNAVSPGYTDTPLLDRLLGGAKDDALAGVRAKLPVGRIATADEVADAVLFLMTNGSVTGEVLHVDGGARLV